MCCECVANEQLLQLRHTDVITFPKPLCVVSLCSKYTNTPLTFQNLSLTLSLSLSPSLPPSLPHSLTNSHSLPPSPSLPRSPSPSLPFPLPLSRLQQESVLKEREIETLTRRAEDNKSMLALQRQQHLSLLQVWALGFRLQDSGFRL